MPCPSTCSTTARRRPGGRSTRLKRLPLPASIPGNFPLLSEAVGTLKTAFGVQVLSMFASSTSFPAQLCIVHWTNSGACTGRNTHTLPLEPKPPKPPIGHLWMPRILSHRTVPFQGPKPSALSASGNGRDKTVGSPRVPLRRRTRPA